MRIYNGQVLLEKGLERCDVLVENGRIAAIEPPSGAGDMDAQGRFVAPGFVDIHQHGGGGYDYMDGTIEAICGAARTHLFHGTTTILPTTLCAQNEDLYRLMAAFDTAAREPDMPCLAGVHLEGPYFSLQQAGAQDPAFIRNPDKAEYLRWLDDFDKIRIWSIAPELEGALELGDELKKRGIVASIGHSDGTAMHAREAQAHGYTMMTHLYSGMAGTRRFGAWRHAGLVEAGLLYSNYVVEVIADGKHLPAELLQLIVKCKGRDGICLITDAIRAAGQDVKVSFLGSEGSGQRVCIENGVAMMPGGQAFAGSVATADQLIRTMMTLGGVSLEDAVYMMTKSPAKAAGLETKGEIAPGKDADIIFFDQDVHVSTVIVGGRLCTR